MATRETPGFPPMCITSLPAWQWVLLLAEWNPCPLQVWHWLSSTVMLWLWVNRSETACWCHPNALQAFPSPACSADNAEQQLPPVCRGGTSRADSVCHLGGEQAVLLVSPLLPGARVDEGCSSRWLQPRAAVGVTQQVRRVLPRELIVRNLPLRQQWCVEQESVSSERFKREQAGLTARLGEGGSIRSLWWVYFVTSDPSVYVQLSSTCILRIVWLLVPHIPGYACVSKAHCILAFSLIYSCPLMLTLLFKLNATVLSLMIYLYRAITHTASPCVAHPDEPPLVWAGLHSLNTTVTVSPCNF